MDNNIKSLLDELSGSFIQKTIAQCPRSLKEAASFKKHIIATCCLVKDIEDIDQDFIRNFKNTNAYKYFSAPKHIQQKLREKSKAIMFAEKNKDYLRFIAKTEDLNEDILRKFNGFFVKKAPKVEGKKTRYLRRNVSKKFVEDFKQGEDILISGPPETGKTRLVYEGLKELKLKKYYIFSLSQSAFDNIDKLLFAEDFNPEKRELIWFIDDLQYPALGVEDKPFKMLEKLNSEFKKITVIATLQSDIDRIGKTKLTKVMEPLEIPAWSKNECDGLADLYNLPHSSTGGNPLSVLGNIKRMKKLYDEEVENKCKAVLRHLKLLQQFLQFIEYKLLEDTYVYLRKNLSNKDDFKKCLDKLKEGGFLYRDKKIISSWELYFKEIVTIEDYPNIDFDREKLITFFAGTGRIMELSLLGRHFYIKNDWRRSIDCQKETIDTNPDKKYIATAYFLWGVILGSLAEATNDTSRYKEACSKYKLATQAKTDFAGAYYNWGIILGLLGNKNNDGEKYEEACSKYKLATQAKTDFAEAYLLWGITLAALGKKNNDGGKYEEACSKFESATQAKTDFAEAYFLWGAVLVVLAKRTNNTKKYKEAYSKYKLAVKYNPEYAYKSYILKN